MEGLKSLSGHPLQQQEESASRMAKNFRIQANHGERCSLALKLFGDFDATSACELIHILNENVSEKQRVCINTDGLRNINAFGLDVLLPRISRLNRNRLPIEVTGRFSEVFQEE
jgi:anti-anti-sigma regulatory factor